MITRRTKIQLLIFAIITLVGVSYVGARYAQLDRVVLDDSYEVVAHFPDSGGAFAGAEVTYRGVTIGKIDKMVLTDEGVDMHLSIQDDWDRIPAETEAIVGNRSAVGEQYVELQPIVGGEPFLENGSEIAEERTDIPIATSKLLEDISTTVSDVNQDALRTSVNELGLAFDGTGENLAQIIETSNSFIATANDNFELTRALIQDSNKVLKTQLASGSAIRNFSQNFALFSTTLAGADGDLRRLIDAGSPAATELRTFIEQNRVDLSSLLNNLVTTGEVVVANLDGIEQLMVLYPYAVEGGYSVASKDPDTGLYNAHFGLITTEHHLCHQGYDGVADTRGPLDGSNRPMNTRVRCAEPPTSSNPRGAQNAPRAPVGYQAPVVAEYDQETGEVTWLGAGSGLSVPGTVAEQFPRPTSGEESWKWLLLQPIAPATD